MKRSTLVHAIAYTTVAALCFWSGAVTRDYLVTREAKLDRERPHHFVNQRAPAIEAKTIDGEPWRLADVQGKVVVIEAWASWCGPCIAHLPSSKSLYERFKDNKDFVYVSLSLDKDAAMAKAFREAHGLPDLVLLDPGHDFDSAAPRALEIDRIPFSCVIDKEGIMRRYDDQSSGEYAQPTTELVARLLAVRSPNSKTERKAR